MNQRSNSLQMLLKEESSSDEDDDFIFEAIETIFNDNNEEPKRGRSVFGHAVINRERDRTMTIFPEEPKYLHVHFRRRQFTTSCKRTSLNIYGIIMETNIK
uniref:Uncharacterized protein n=1 Tax=Oryza punctata TaxID=4537 RepID=A0A0E0KZJ7_ORYPU